MKYSYYSDKGNHKKRNEDAFEIHIATSANRMRGMIAICDGVSSSDDGKYASRFVVSRLHELFEQWKEHSLDWHHEVNKVHEELYEQGKHSHKRYGTTLSLFYFEDDNYHILQVGDSRIYLYQDTLKQLSIDQTLAQQKYINQTISLEQLYESNERHILTQCIGITKRLSIVEDSGIWHRQDGVLVCSDGISNLLSESMLSEHMRLFLSEGSDEARKLGEEALALGEHDNLSAILFSRGEMYENA